LKIWNNEKVTNTLHNLLKIFYEIICRMIFLKWFVPKYESSELWSKTTVCRWQLRVVNWHLTVKNEQLIVKSWQLQLLTARQNRILQPNDQRGFVQQVDLLRRHRGRRNDQRVSDVEPRQSLRWRTDDNDNDRLEDP
jgi:hypothetical protein